MSSEVLTDINDQQLKRLIDIMPDELVYLFNGWLESSYSIPEKYCKMICSFQVKQVLSFNDSYFQIVMKFAETVKTVIYPHHSFETIFFKTCQAIAIKQLSIPPKDEWEQIAIENNSDITELEYYKKDSDLDVFINKLLDLNDYNQEQTFIMMSNLINSQIESLYQSKN